ncbi:MAG: class I SAM-dependent methyltransferase [Candidatus Heimdallarchaeota archaeon]
MKKGSLDNGRQVEPKFDDTNSAVPFTARLMAYYRAKEYENDHPWILDPFAARLAGDMREYVNKHSHFSEIDYGVVRSYYIEHNLLTPWCTTQTKSQIVLLGAGLDTRAYRFQPLQTNTHHIFELDFPIVIEYKGEVLKDEKPLCELVRIPADLSHLDWSTQLIASGFSSEVPTFWVLEGLAYYMEEEEVISLLKKAAEISSDSSQIFVDVCVPSVAELDFGPFTRHFKWGLEKEAVPRFFAATDWNVSCSFADDYDQGRDVGQRGNIFIHGVLEVCSLGIPDESSDEAAPEITMTGPELEAFARKLTKKVIPEVERIVEIYKRAPEEGGSAYFDFLRRMKPTLEKIIGGLKDRASLGLISPRLLRDPLSIEPLVYQRFSNDEKEAHIVGYLKAILQLLYCRAKGIEGWQFAGTSLHEASVIAQSGGKIRAIPILAQIVKQEIGS